MAGVLDQPALGGRRLGQPIEHAVEAVAEGLDLGGRALQADALVEGSLLDLVGQRRDVAERAHGPAGPPPCGDDPDEGDDRGGGQHPGRGAGRAGRHDLTRAPAIVDLDRLGGRDDGREERDQRQQQEGGTGDGEPGAEGPRGSSPHATGSSR